jgi:hypothetical protein
MPDTKDWSWVVRRPCPECGPDASALTRADIPTMLRTNAAGWQLPLSAQVATEIRDAAAVAAGRFGRVTGDQWLRKGQQSWRSVTSPPLAAPVC